VDTKIAVNEIKKIPKSKVIDALQIELKTITSTFHLQFATDVYSAVTVILLVEDCARGNAHQVIAIMLATHEEALLKHLNISSEDFKRVYKNTHTLASLPNLLSLNTNSQAQKLRKLPFFSPNQYHK